MRSGHFDYGNGFHGRVYLNAHQLFRHPSTIWRLAQDLLDVLPGDLLEQTEVVAGPVMGGALLAHTLAALRDPGAAGGRYRAGDGGDLRSHGGDCRRWRPELRAGRVQGARELPGRPL